MNVEMERNGLPSSFATTADMTKPSESVPYEVSNTIAAASNAESGHEDVDAKSILQPMPSTEHEMNTSLQPVREPESTTLVQGTLLPPASNGTSEMPGLQTTFPLNGTLPTENLNSNSALPQASEFAPPRIESEVPSIQEVNTQQSSLPMSSSIDSTAPSSVPVETEPPLSASLLSQPIAADLATALHQPDLVPTSDLRNPPEAVSSEAALRLKSDMDQIDLAADSNVTGGLVPAGNALKTEDTTTLLSSTNAIEPPGAHFDVGAVDMDISSTVPPPANATDAPLPAQPPPAPHPAPAILPAERSDQTAPTKVEPPVEVHASAMLDAEQTSSQVYTAPTESPAPQEDAEMADAPVQSPVTKVAREREDDGEEEVPSAKRARVEDESADTEFKVPEIPQAASSPAVQNGDKPNAQSGNASEDGEITPARLAQMKKIISNLKKGAASQFFRIPVNPVAMNLPTYFDVVKEPMDLTTIDTKLKSQTYSAIAEFRKDFEQIIKNTEAFNGQPHAVTVMAHKMLGSFNNQMTNMPPVSIAQPIKEEKKAHKVQEQPTRSIPARRPSTSAATPVRNARSPAAASGQTFAVGAEGIPTIRRDSTITDGRPKRAIRAPKRARDLGGARPKKKKYELQLKFCQEVLNEVKSRKNWEANQYFMEPVDPVALNIPTYLQIIKKPMDIGTVQRNLEGGFYERAKDFEEDFGLILKNCFRFNKEGDYVYQRGQALERIFNAKWADKDTWIAAREPVSEPQSPDDDEDEEEDESGQEDADDSEEERNQKIAELQKQMEAMSQSMRDLNNKKNNKKKTPPVAPAKKSHKKSVKKEKHQPTFPALQQPAKEKKKVKTKPERERYISYNEKQYISLGIGNLDERPMQEALKIIQSNVPALANTDQSEIELDIDELPNHVLLKLLNHVKKHVPNLPGVDPLPAPVFAAPVATSKPKKNKPMSKHEQEAQIEELKGKLGQYQGGGPTSPDPHQSIEDGNDSSDDEDDSEESEEE